jgi:hypothetical protein
MDGRNGEANQARTICLGCPVRAECAAEALVYLDRTPQSFRGIWAGVIINSHQPTAREQLRRLATGDISGGPGS